VLPGGAGAPAASGQVRITRRGRLALLALVLAIVAAVGVMGMRGAGAVEPTRTVTVSAGQTLSEIAATQLPDMSISEGILAIQLANEMSTAQISAGQQLVIPRS
jgi:predicted Zn-dependent protease